MTAVMERVDTASKPATRPWWPLGLGLVLLTLCVATVAALYLSVPKGNEDDGPVDALLVLGTPAGMDGKLTESQRWRVDEAVREFRRGRAPRMLITGGPTSHSFVEADVMAAYARQQGIPADAILEERTAMTTVQNIRNASAILRAHGLRRIEVISTVQHLPRAAVLLEKTDFEWRTHPAPTPDRGWADTTVAWVEEAVGTAAFRIFGPRAEPVLHALARGQHGLSYGVRWTLYRIQDAMHR